MLILTIDYGIGSYFGVVRSMSNCSLSSSGYIYLKKKHASRHHPERRPRDGFDWNPSEPVTLFIKCVRCTLPFRQGKAVPYLSRKYGQQQKIE